VVHENNVLAVSSDGCSRVDGVGGLVLPMEGEAIGNVDGVKILVHAPDEGHVSVHRRGGVDGHSRRHGAQKLPGRRHVIHLAVVRAKHDAPVVQDRGGRSNSPACLESPQRRSGGAVEAEGVGVVAARTHDVVHHRWGGYDTVSSIVHPLRVVRFRHWASRRIRLVVWASSKLRAADGCGHLELGHASTPTWGHPDWASPASTHTVDVVTAKSASRPRISCWCCE
jgi:hypothetical protein